MQLIWKVFQIKCISTSIYNPKANGSNEVVHNFINQRIGIYNIQGRHHDLRSDHYEKDKIVKYNKNKFSGYTHKLAVPNNWSEYLKSIQFAVNVGVSRKTKLSPHESKFGFLPRLPIDNQLNVKELSENGLTEPELTKYINKYYGHRYKEKIKYYHELLQHQLNMLRGQINKNKTKYNKEKEKQINKNIKIKPFEIGDNVMLWKNFIVGGDKSRKYRERWQPGWFVLKKLNGGINYKLKHKSSGEVITAHRDHLRKYNQQTLMLQDKLVSENEEIRLHQYFDLKRQQKKFNEIKLK